MDKTDDQTKYLEAATKLRAQFENTQFHLANYPKEFKEKKNEEDLGDDDVERKDPALLAVDMAERQVCG